MRATAKFCSGCSETKPRTEFCGKSSRCRKCKAERCAEWRRINPGYKPRWRRANPDKEYAYNRKRQLKQKYGITPEEYRRWFEIQRGVCAICENASRHTLNVDHDHHTGEVRGLLCKACNRGLGMFKDNPELVKRATEYLTRSIGRYLALSS